MTSGEKQNDTDDGTLISYMFDDKCSVTQHLLLNENSERSERKPEGVTLLVTHVPPYADEDCLRRIFTHCGKVKDVFFQKKEGAEYEPPVYNKGFPSILAEAHPKVEGFKIGYVVFTKEKAVSRALNMSSSKVHLLSTPEHPVLTGLKKIKADEERSRSVNADLMEAQCAEYLRLYDMRVEKDKEESLAMEGVPDKDGWITVTKHSKNRGLSLQAALPSDSGSALKRKKVSGREKKKKKSKELLDFYDFHLKDSKKQKLDGLQKKFEEKKKIVNEKKAARKFKPH